MAEKKNRYESFGVPPHVWVESDGTAQPAPLGWNRRNWILREVASLDEDSMPPVPLPDSEPPA